MPKKIVAVLFGGRSTEHEISCLSASNIISAISKDKYEVLPIYINREGEWLLFEGAFDDIKNIDFNKYGVSVSLSPNVSHKGFLRIVGDKVKTILVDVVFPVLHGKNGEDGTIAALCELASIPYVGCGVLSSSLCMDKAFTNLIAQYNNINQADFLVYMDYDITDNIEEVAKQVRYKLGYPCFVKPANAGSSIGVGKATNKKQLIAALNSAIEYDKKIVIEKGIIGRELECAVVGNRDVFATSVGEILSSSDFYDYKAKYESKDSITVAPADIPEEIEAQIRELSIKIFKLVDGKGLSRVDFFLEEGTNKVMFNEINTFPGFTKISLFPVLCNNAGISTTDLVDKLIELALAT